MVIGTREQGLRGSIDMQRGVDKELEGTCGGSECEDESVWKNRVSYLVVQQCFADWSGWLRGDWWWWSGRGGGRGRWWSFVRHCEGRSSLVRQSLDRHINMNAELTEGCRGLFGVGSEEKLFACRCCCFCLEVGQRKPFFWSAKAPVLERRSAWEMVRPSLVEVACDWLVDCTIFDPVYRPVVQFIHSRFHGVDANELLRLVRALTRFNSVL